MTEHDQSSTAITERFTEHQMRTATVRTEWSTGANMAVATPVFTVKDTSGRVVAEMNFAEFKAEFAQAIRAGQNGSDLSGSAGAVGPTGPEDIT